MINQSRWDELTIERRSAPPRLSDDRFRDWMGAHPIFVSSPMDPEMTPAREAVRAWVHSWGGEPVMWEEITPRDQRAQDAYLDGVDRSDVFALLLGSSYGTSDHTGFSPTHRESERAEERGLTRLLFLRDGIPNSERDGKLNRWIGSLYNEVSGARYREPDDLTRALEARLREIAGGQETPWIKLGTIVFPGKVRQHTVSGETRCTVTATVRDPVVRHALGELNDWHRRSRSDRLTWGMLSWPIEVQGTEIDTQAVSSDEVVITCRRDPRRGDGGMGLGNVNFMEQGRTVGPSEQVIMWVDQALLGTPRPARGGMSAEYFAAPDGPVLPEVLAREQARGWTAEGLVRLYLAEGLLSKYGGRFERLDVGPATASGVRVNASFRPGGHGHDPAQFNMIVPLPLPR